MKRPSLRLFVALAVIALTWLQVAPAAGQTAPAPTAPKALPPPAAAPAASRTAPPPADSGDAAVASMIAAAGAEGDRWLELIDHGKFDESWIAAAPVLQETITQKEWSADVATRKAKLGRTIMRERKTESYSKTLRGAPTGDYVTVTYLTKFEKTPLVEETLALARDGVGQWHVAGYDIKLSSVPAP